MRGRISPPIVVLFAVIIFFFALELHQPEESGRLRRPSFESLVKRESTCSSFWHDTPAGC